MEYLLVRRFSPRFVKITSVTQHMLIIFMLMRVYYLDMALLSPRFVKIVCVTQHMLIIFMLMLVYYLDIIVWHTNKCPFSTQTSLFYFDKLASLSSQVSSTCGLHVLVP